MKNGENAVSLTSKTDYYPFGMPMPNRNIEGNYRYKFQGQEKDPETGKEAFELRLWDSRIGRWLTPDPYGEFSSPYIGMGNNPLKYVDIDGGRIYIWHTVGGKLTKFEYKNGSLYYASNGKQYAGTDSFLTEVKNSLSKLDYGYQYKNWRMDSNGNSSSVGFINSLVTSKKVYEIQYAKGRNVTQGLRIYLDPTTKVKTYTLKGYKLSPFFVTVGHELGHAYDNANGIADKSVWYKLDTNGDGVKNYPVKKSEQFASAIENMFRGEPPARPSMR